MWRKSSSLFLEMMTKILYLNLKDVLIRSRFLRWGRWVVGLKIKWFWVLRWRKDFFVSELNLLYNFFEILNWSPIYIEVDSWCWKEWPKWLFLSKVGLFGPSSVHSWWCFSLKYTVTPKNVENVNPLISGSILLATSLE
jgi:hypothetical protein